tara:strand:+ start:20456 stop:21112 length:657 start_codon:yes stop_codon:yes gene_type:complete
LPKRVLEKQKQELIAAFKNGHAIEELSQKFNISKTTISRHLKKEINESKYKEIIKNNKRNKKNITSVRDCTSKLKNSKDEHKISDADLSNSENAYPDESFFEIAPLNLDIDNEPRKDLSSVSISEFIFPNMVYMIVDKKIELETKYLKEYPEWQFLSQKELNRNTIQIFFDLKAAKRFCNKEQKVIKVPNTQVFKIAAPSLLKKGISRIVTEDKLIAL